MAELRALLVMAVCSRVEEDSIAERMRLRILLCCDSKRDSRKGHPPSRKTGVGVTLSPSLMNIVVYYFGVGIFVRAQTT